jgi:hypothetical protein
LYVDPPFSVFGAARLRKLNTATGSVPEALRVLEARAVLPVSGYVPLVNAMNGALIGKRLRRELEKNGHRPPAAIVTSFAKQLHVLPWLPKVPVCYDIMDDYPLFFDRWQGAMLARWHEQLVRRADVVTVSSRTLGERYGDRAKRVECITNGVGADFVAACATAAPDPEITAYPVPRFGYVGAIAPWFDFEAVERLANAYPSGSCCSWVRP